MAMSSTGVRQTAELVALLQRLARAELDEGYNEVADGLREAADRLAELEVEIDTLHGRWLDAEGTLRGELSRIGFLLPPCPQEGCENGMIWTGAYTATGAQLYSPCPENGGNCVGKVPVERLVKVFEAVWDEQATFPLHADGSDAARSFRSRIQRGDGFDAWRICIDHLRSIR